MKIKDCIDPTNKIFFHPEILTKFLNGSRIYPISIEMDLSDECNLKCNWCRYAEGHKPNVMSLQLAKKILWEAQSLGIKSVVYSGGGEPLLNPEFELITKVANQAGLDQGIYTNGCFIDSQIQPLSHLMKFIYISLDAATKETYERIKHSDQFERVLCNIRMLAEQKRKARVGLGFLVSPENSDEIEAFAGFLGRFDIDYIHYRPAITSDIDKRWLRSVIRRLQKIEGPRTLVANYKFQDLLNDGKRTYKECFGHYFLSGITADGSVWLCLNHRYHEQFKLGDANTQTLYDIWREKRIREVKKRLDISKCPILCRPHELNKVLDPLIRGNEHANFL